MGRQGMAVKTDVSRRDEVAHLVDETLKTFGGIHILVNDAGMQGPIGLLVDNDIDQWVRTVHVNLIGTFLCMKAVLPHMIERRQGKIINLSGGGAAAPRPHFSAYAVSKAAIGRLTETVAEEVRPFNIHINAIAPGVVRTRMLEEILAAGEAAGEAELAQVRHQLGRSGSFERVVDLAVFLASLESDGITGKLISAMHDDWQRWPKLRDKLASSDLYTLRRLDASTIRRLIPDWRPPWE
jgi:3-oxoacyl-[acyl-carrier protein] reductase